MPGYEVAKYDLIWICDSGIRGKIFLFYKTVHLMVKYQKHFENIISLSIFGLCDNLRHYLWYYVSFSH